MSQSKLALILLMLIFCEVAGASQRPIRVNIDSLPITLEPPVSTDTYANWVLLHLADRLIEEHRVNQMVGNLATSWDVSDDFKTYRFNVRDDKRFSDGSPVDAPSIRTSLLLAKSKGGKGRLGLYLQLINSIEVTSRRALTIKLRKPIVNFLQILSDPGMSIYKFCGKQLCFSGEFQLIEIKPPQLVLERKSDGQRFHLIQMTFPQARYRFRNGALEILHGFAFDHYQSIKTVSEKIITFRDGKSYFIALNSRAPRFDTAEKRCRFKHSIDWNSTRRFLTEVGLELAESFFPPSLSTGKPELRAKTPIQKSISSKNEHIRFLTLDSHSLHSFVSKMLPFKAMTMMTLPKADFIRTFRSGRFDAMMIGFGLTIRDWDFVSTFFASKSPNNMAHLANKTVDRLLEQGRASQRPNDRIQLYSTLLKLNEKECWYIPITHSLLAYGLGTRLSVPEQYQLIGTSPFLNLADVKVLP